MNPQRFSTILAFTALAAAACSSDSPWTAPKTARAVSPNPTPFTPPPPAPQLAPPQPAPEIQEPPPSPNATAEPQTPPPAEPPAPPPLPSITSIGYTTWIWPRPNATGTFIGYIRVGRSIPLRSESLISGQNCRGGFFQIAPHGYICNDRTVTRSPDPQFSSVADLTGPSSGPFPYRYAISAGAPMYNRLPTPDEQKRFERKYGPAGKWTPLIKTLAAHEDLAVPTSIEPSGPMPSFLQNNAMIVPDRLGLVRETIPRGSMLSFTASFEANGRTFLLSTDHTLVPADRVRIFRPSSFAGVRLGSDVQLPIAWMRKTEKPKYILGDSGDMVPLGSNFPLRSWVMLTGKQTESGGKRFLETKESSGGKPVYVAEEDATVVEQAKKRPMGVAEGQKWIHVRITQGTLVAYEERTPVYATLMSPGAGGVPIRGADPVKMSTTPTGTYYITFKDRAATMSPDKPGEERTLWISDVPHTQYFHPPFAIHAAYWHERFGEPTSAGCVNVSPIDAEVLFQWSDPPVPQHWQGATGSGAPMNGPTTAVVVSR